MMKLIFLLFHFYLHLHFHSHFHSHSPSHFRFHLLIFLFYFHFLIFNFLLLIFLFLLLIFFSSFDDISVLSVKVVSDKSLNQFNNSFCPGINLFYFNSEFFIMFNVFKGFLASISLIVLSLILLANSLMSIYLKSPILFLWPNILSIIVKNSLNLFLSIQLGLFISFGSSINSLMLASLTMLFF